MPDFGRWAPNGGDPSLNEINRTDRFLDALAFDQPVYATDAGEAELIGLLSGWRDEIREKPLTVPVTPRDAVIALDAAQRSRKRSRRTLALVGSTAAAVLCLGGFASVVAGAGPGDSLYGLRTMIFGEQQTTRDDAVMLASQQLAEVQRLVDEGQWDAAQQKLQTLTTTVATVNDDVQKQELVSEWQELTVKVEAQDAAATLPPDVPPPTFPEVVVLDTPTSSEGTSSDTTTTAPESTPPTSSLPTPTSSLPTPSGPLTTPLPTPSGPLPTPTGPLPTPSAPLPTPSAPLPTPTSVQATQLPTPTPTVATSAPATAAVTTPPAPSAPASEAAEEVPAPAEEVPAPAEAPATQAPPPPAQREAPDPPMTTIIEVPAADPGSGGSGGSGRGN